jgi:hypothetical protein
MGRSLDVPVGDGRFLRAYDSGLDGNGGVVVWHHGLPQTGALLEPLLVAAAERGIRLLSYTRPGYGGLHPASGTGCRVGAGCRTRRWRLWGCSGSR